VQWSGRLPGGTNSIVEIWITCPGRLSCTGDARGKKAQKFLIQKPH
jgi:hypothetical protein